MPMGPPHRALALTLVLLAGTGAGHALAAPPEVIAPDLAAPTVPRDVPRSLGLGIWRVALMDLRASGNPTPLDYAVATAGNAQVSVAFGFPNANGSTITSYTAQCTGSTTFSGPTSPIVVTGLTNGTPVSCTVFATNGVSNGAASAPSNTVTPATVPDAPTAVLASAGSGRVTVSFSAPASNGGSAITGYTATCGAQSQSGAGSPIVVTGLPRLTWLVELNISQRNCTNFFSVT